MSKYKSHYRKYLSVYRKLATANGGKTVWIPTDSHSGWYVTEPTEEGTRGWEDGYPKQSRPSVLPDDLSADVERTAYTTISYASEYTTKYYREIEDGIEWLDNSTERLPDYDELTAWALFVDIDIADKYKKRPLPDTHRDIIEKRLKLWVDAFSSMAGDSVMSLDSGGGCYVFVPPTALSPVADRYDGTERRLIFNEIGKRMRAVTGKLDELICNQDNAPDELFSADKVQNKNRQFKTIGAIHKSLDAVVHPIDPMDIQIQHKRVQDVSEKDVFEAEEWAEEFVDDRHKERVGDVVEYLFQGDFVESEDMEIEYVDGGSWTDILDSWVEDKKEAVKTWREARERLDELDDEVLDVEFTQDKEVAQEAIRRVNNHRLKQYIVDFLGEENVYENRGNEEMDFFPFWRAQTTETGRSAFYDFYEGEARFTDKADGTSRDIVYWVALEMTYSDEYEEELLTSPSDSLDGEAYKRAVSELRRRGEPIPILLKNVEDNQKLPSWQIRNVALELGIADKDDLINGERLSDEDWNTTLERLDEEGITHNREYRQPLTPSQILPSESQRKSLGKDRANAELFNKKGYYRDVFETQEEYERFLSQLPTFVISFTYNKDEILGGSPNPVMAGVFTEQTKEKVRMTRFDPMVRNNIEHIDTYEDIAIETDEWLDKKYLEIYTKL